MNKKLIIITTFLTCISTSIYASPTITFNIANYTDKTFTLFGWYNMYCYNAPSYPNTIGGINTSGPGTVVISYKANCGNSQGGIEYAVYGTSSFTSTIFKVYFSYNSQTDTWTQSFGHSSDLNVVPFTDPLPPHATSSTIGVDIPQ
ncbi:MAG: hypothetical protein JSR33_05930 [Proteobacteria bacterium]|nr:hypothetical protein [Pseudomonadota bacterium]